MMDLNRWEAMGYVGQDPRVEEYAEGKKRALFSLAIHRRDGDGEEITDWFDVVAFGRLAETVENLVHQGTRLYMEAELRDNRWQDQEGNTRRRVNIVARRIRLLSPPPEDYEEEE